MRKKNCSAVAKKLDGDGLTDILEEDMKGLRTEANTVSTKKFLVSYISGRFRGFSKVILTMGCGAFLSSTDL